MFVIILIVCWVILLFAHSIWGFIKLFIYFFFKNVQVHDFSVGKEYFNIFSGGGAF